LLTDQVTFSYPTRADEIAIRNVSLFFPAGETTFVIGRSGSGKSTLGQLLVRFYQPLSGRVFLDGNALNDLDVKWLRQNVMLVEQHSVLFEDTIRHNISLGRHSDNVSLQEISEALKFAMLDPIIRDLPDGLDTDLGIKGGSLSGGQKQRMALARAKVRDTPVLILDESTSALDYVTRAAILQAIKSWRKGKTTIIITHDISQIHSGDFLYLMEDSEVVQEGYRKELETRVGPFQALLADHEDREEEVEDEEVDEYDETDEIISLYDETSSNLHSPIHRPMSAVLFGENLLSPILKNGRDSIVGSFMPGLEKTLTTPNSEESSYDSKHVAPHDTVAVTKVPPGMMSAPNTFQSRNPRARSVSMASQNKRHSSGISYNRPLPVSEQFGPRAMYIASTPPGSRRNSSYQSYPRPLSISTSSRVSRDYQKSSSRKHMFHSKLGLRRLKGDVEKQSPPIDTLPIVEIFKSVWPRLEWRSRILLLFAFVCATIHAAATPTFAWVFAQLLTTFYGIGDQSKRSLIYSMAILGIAFIDGLTTYFLFFLADAVAQSWAHALKVEAMRRILMQPREFFDREENSVSRIAETLDHFAEEARNLPGRFAVLFVTIVVMVAISVVWALVTSWKLALVAIATSPILYAITKSYNMISSRWERLANEADDVVAQVLHETFVNIRTVRCLALEDYFRAKYKEATTNAVQIGIKRALYSGSIFGLNFAGTMFAATLFFWYGAVLVATNQYTVSQIIETFLVLMLSINHVTYMGHYITQVNMSREAGSRLLRLARMPTTSHELSGTVQLQAAGDITLRNANFTYPTRKKHQVLHDVSLNIPQGSCTAIVGSSGSGKSTIASLLFKLYEPDTQSLSSPPSFTISGLDIASLHTNTLRSKMAIVSQTPVIFPGTIAENIAYGLSPSSPLASEDSIRAAATAAGVADFIASLPNGYRTLIGEGGTGLSGGQAQRLAIARALARSPDILILDEATSALDGASAGVVRDTIRRLVDAGRDGERIMSRSEKVTSARGGGVWKGEDWEAGAGHGGRWNGGGEAKRRPMTVIIITHAREMMAIAEHIIMLDKGRVVEQGGFLEMKRKKGGAFGRLLRGEA
jgi:ATP-binding cassette subfamily B (MDR/TAP) protein 1